ncbi:MAG TPA: DUF1284 domain-containing protein [Dongiaceae bacterium]|nr:DUF1284 domain-containing protein [Dongiaceae bacterium]
MIRLRPHHLLCILTYAGRGYTPRFTSGMDDLIARLGAGEEITIVTGPDDICAPWLDEAAGNAIPPSKTEIRAPHCHEPRITGRDQKAAGDVGRLLEQEITAGSSLRLDATLIARLRQAFQDNVIRSGCAACEWKDFCDSLSAGDFAGCRLTAER